VAARKRPPQLEVVDANVTPTDSGASVSYLIYGANGYTGELIAREAARRGQRPVLAGRDARAVAALAGELGMEHRSFALDDPRALDAGLSGLGTVLHCAGPFTATARPMVDACLRRRAHYLDITGEVEVFEACATRGEEARGAGVMLLPGAGFDVVPSDCLAAHLKRRLPTATRLTLAFQPSGRLSRGTATTLVEHAHRGGLVRRGGVLTPVPSGWRTIAVDFGRGPRPAISIPWGDVSTAFHSTGIPNIEVYLAAPASARLSLRLSRFLTPLLRSAAVKSYLKRRIRRGAAGPGPEERARGRTILWGEVEDGAGGRVRARLRGPEGYAFTVLTALAVVEQVMAGRAPAGFQTPSRAYGPDFVLQIPGVERVDL
jgi:short subunit dehydrogenase-like uncharacterized protein